MNKKVFTVYFHKKGKGYYEFIPKRHITIGNKSDCDIIDSIPGFPDSHRLLEKSGKRYNLIIPSGIEGVITKESKSLSLQDIIEFNLLKKRGNCYLFPISKKDDCVLTAGEYTFTFCYKEITRPDKKLKTIDKSLKKPWISREDYSFLLIFAFSIIIHFSTVGYLNSIEIKKEDTIIAINKMPKRFARLILQPPKKKAIKTAAEVQSSQKREDKEPEKKVKEEKELQKEMKEADAKKELKKRDENRQKNSEEVTMLQPVEGLSSSEKREVIREKVKTKGLLGVIMARAVSDEISGDIVSRDIGGLMKNIEKGGENKKDVLSALDLKRWGGEELSKNGIDITPRTKKRDNSEIIDEKKDILKEELTKNDDGQSNIKKRDETEVYRTVGSYVGGLKYLYNGALRKNPSLKGKITVKIIISPEGKVIKSEAVSSTLNFPELEEAIINRIYKWRFAEQADVGDFTIDYTFDFAPLG